MGYEQNLELIRFFSQTTKNEELSREAAQFWSQALTVCEDGSPSLQVRRTIRHMAAVLEVVPDEPNPAACSEIESLLIAASEQLTAEDETNQEFDALAYRVKRMRDTLG